jgi:hypothetical protein
VVAAAGAALKRELGCPIYARFSLFLLSQLRFIFAQWIMPCWGVNVSSPTDCRLLLSFRNHFRKIPQVPLTFNGSLCLSDSYI